jgi:uncharacterized protein with FMN-binding domain
VIDRDTQIHSRLTATGQRALNFDRLNGDMEVLPPPQRPVAIDNDRTERLAALAARRQVAADNDRTEPTREVLTDADRVAARLAALSARRDTTTAPTADTRTTNRTRSKRHHPAKAARVAALGLSLASTGGLAALFAVTNAQTGNELQTARVVTAPSATAAGPVSSAASSAGGDASGATSRSVNLAVPAPTEVISPIAPAANTVVDGGVFHNKWGDVQVQATFAPDGTLLDVTTLQTPYRDGKSVRINNRAVPQLNAEALSVQSANVDTVSGATYTSNDYSRSLQSAIDAAALAGIAAAAAA